MYRSLRYFKPAHPFRDKFLYNNHLYALAGYVAEVLEDQSWEDLVTKYLLKPLGMTSTTFVRDVLMTPPDNMAASCGWTGHDCAPVDIQLLEYMSSVISFIIHTSVYSLLILSAYSPTIKPILSMLGEGRNVVRSLAAFVQYDMRRF